MPVNQRATRMVTTIATRKAATVDKIAGKTP